MKKVVALLLTLVLCLSLVAACGKKEAGSPEEVEGEVYDAGSVSALVPEGWKAFPVADFWSDDADAVDPTTFQIVKDGETEWDILTKPYVQIFYYGADTDMLTPDSSWYDDAEDLDSFTTGDYTWEGFTGKSFDVPITILWTEVGDIQYQINMCTETDDETISLEDADVQAILASIEATE